MARQCAAVLLAALALLAAADARQLLQLAAPGPAEDPPGEVITGSHTEHDTYAVAGNGCQTFQTTPDKAIFNYTSTISYARLPSGCKASDLKVTKLYTRGSCAETRADNYAVRALGITNAPGCAAVAGNDSATCTATFGAAPDEAIISAPNSGQEIDHGEICWAAPFVYVFVQNSCQYPISVTVTNLFNDYDGSCTEGDGDDGDSTASASNSGGDVVAASADKKDGGLSSGAKAGIAIGVIVGVALIVGAILYFFCCQLGGRK